jgi:hypothetical protein
MDGDALAQHSIGCPVKDDLLNENQRRRIATHLHLLGEDLATLGRLPELHRAGPAYDRVRALFSEITQKATAVRQELGLDVPSVPPLRRRVGAVAEIWAVRMEDLTARRLQSSGNVHPGLAERLDPRISELTLLLERLADVAVELPGD